MPIVLRPDTSGLGFPIQHQLCEGGIVDGDDFERNSLVDDHAAKKQFSCFCDVQSDPLKHVLGSEFDFRSCAHLNHGAADDPAHRRSISKVVHSRQLSRTGYPIH
jgi:hypothetical protein